MKKYSKYIFKGFLNMSKDLKERLKEEMERRKMKVPQLSLELDIPKDRIYAWYRDKTNPKDQDSKKIENWLNGVSSIINNKDTIIGPEVYSPIDQKDQSFKTLVEIINKQADTIKSQQETIFFLATKGGDAGGRAVAASG